MFLKQRPALCQRMARQKVKGTGHKQPADAKTEPNFYLMPPVESFIPANAALTVPPRHNFGSTAGTFPPSFGAASLPPQAAAMGRSLYESPASPGLHGAAHLLQGIASGYHTLNLPRPPLGGVAAVPDGDTSSNEQDDTALEASTDPEQQHQGRPASFLQPRLSNPSSYEKV